MQKLIMLFFAILLTAVQVRGATPETVNDVKQQYIQKFPWVMLMALDPTDPTKVVPILIDPSGAFAITFPSGTSIEQGDQAATSGSPWYFTQTRRSDGAEFGLAASPFGVQLFDAVAAALGVTANPLIIQNLATAPAAMRLSDGTDFYDAIDQATGDSIETNTKTGQAASEPVVIAVGSTPTLIFAASTTTRTVTMQHMGEATIFLGKSAVTTTTGIPLKSGTVDNDAKGDIAVADHGDDIYGIVVTGTENLRIQVVSD